MVTSAPPAPPTGRTVAPLASTRTLTAAAVAAVSLAIALLALVLPAWPVGPDMGSTHYMGLLADNQPWNLLLFMAIPVVLAETIAVTELVVLFGRRVPPVVAALNRYAGLVAGFCAPTCCTSRTRPTGPQHSSARGPGPRPSPCARACSGRSTRSPPAPRSW